MMNQRTIFRLLGFIPALAILAAGGPSAEAGPVNVGRVTAYHGNVQITRAATNATFQVQDEQPVLFRDVHETDFDSQVELRFKDGSTLVIGEDTVLTIDEMVFDPKTGRRSAVLNLRAGSLRLKATKNHLPGSKFEVKTPILVAGLRGTELTVTVDKKTGQARVITLEGAVAVWKRGAPKGARKEVLVVAGMTTAMTAGASGPADAARATREMIRSAANGAATRAAKIAVQGFARNACKEIATQTAKNAAKSAAKEAVRNAAGQAVQIAAHQAASNAASNAAKEAANNAAKNASKQAAKNAANDAAKEAADNAAKNAAKQVANNAASQAASNAAAEAAKNNGKGKGKKS